MKTNRLRQVSLFVCLALALFGQFIFKAQAEPSSDSEKARTLKMIAPYRTWGSVNQQPILVQVDQMAPAG